MKKYMYIIVVLCCVCFLTGCSREKAPNKDQLSNDEAVNKTSNMDTTIKDLLVNKKSRLGNTQQNMGCWGGTYFDGEHIYYTTMDGLYKIDKSGIKNKVLSTEGSCDFLCKAGNLIVFMEYINNKDSTTNKIYLRSFNKTTGETTILLDLSDNFNAYILNAIGTKIYYNAVDDDISNFTYVYDLLTGENQFFLSEGALMNEKGIYFVAENEVDNFNTIMFKFFDNKSDIEIAKIDGYPRIESGEYLILQKYDNSCIYRLNLKTKEYETIIDKPGVTFIMDHEGDLIWGNCDSLYRCDINGNNTQELLNRKEIGLDVLIPNIIDGQIVYTNFPKTDLYFFEQRSNEETYENMTYENMTSEELAEELIWLKDYSWNGCFSEGLIAVCKDGYWGYVDGHNNIKIDFMFNDAYAFEHGRAVVSGQEMRGVIDKTGNYIIEPKYKDIWIVSDQFIEVGEWTNAYYPSEEYKLLADINGNMIIPNKCKDILIGDNNLITAYEYDKNDQYNTLYKVYTYHGNLFREYEGQVGRYSEEYASYRVKEGPIVGSGEITGYYNYDGLYTYIDTDGYQVTENIYVVANEFKNGMTTVASLIPGNDNWYDEDVLWQVIDKDFNIISTIGSGGFSCNRIYDEYAILEYGDGWSGRTYKLVNIYNTSKEYGNFSYCESYDDVNCCIVQDSETGFYGLFKEGELIYDCIYNDISYNGDGIFILVRGLNETTYEAY